MGYNSGFKGLIRVHTEVQLGIIFFTCTSIGFNLYFALRHSSSTASTGKERRTSYTLSCHKT